MNAPIPANRAKDRIRPRTAVLIVSALILMLPNLNVIDILPDAIACLLLLWVIAPYAVIDAHMLEAQRYLEHMLLISVAELVSVAFVYVFLAAAPQEQPMTLLLCCFVFAFFRIKTIFPLTRELAEGLTYLDTRNDGTLFCRHHTKVCLRRAPNGARRIKQYPYSVTDRMMRATRTFVVATSILNALPEFAALSYVPGDDTVRNMYEFISLLRGFCMLISFVFGVVFLCRTISFAKAIAKDRAYYTRLNALYVQDELAHPERKIQSYLRRTFLLITAFAVFTMDFIMDRINVLPDFIGALLLIAAFLLLRRYISKCMPAILSAIGYGVASVAHFTVNTAFWQRHVPESINRSERVRALYVPVEILSCVEALMLLMCMFFLFRALFEIIDRYTGYEIEGSANYSREEKLQQEHTATKRGMIGAMVLSFMTVLSGPMFAFLRPTVEFAWIFSVIIPAVFTILLTLAMMRIRDGVDSRFLLK